jgi:UDP-2,3-diacylglucosamine pyrophosphatase LpxH
MKTRIIFLVSLFLVTLKAVSQNIDNENLKITHGPYLQNPGTGGVTIIWTTNRPAVPGVLLTGPNGEKRFVRNSHDGMTDGGGTLHKVRIDGLEPGTSYKYNLSSIQILKYQAYKVYYGDTITRKAENFTTLSLKTDKINFLVINDVHENSAKLGSYLRNGKAAEKDFLFFNGDMVDFLQETSQLFAGFLDTATTCFASVKPFYYIRGNHETRGYMARDLKEYFDFKDDRFYYCFDNGPVHFIILDCGEDKPDDNRYYYGLADYDNYRKKELEWLKEEVKSNNFKNAKFRIVMVHMPIIKEEKQAWGMKFLADNFGPVLQSAGINLMMSAHTHRAAFYEKDKSGFGYPVLVNSNNEFVEVNADLQGIKAVVKDLEGKIINTYSIK